MDRKPSFSTDSKVIMILSLTKIHFLSQIWLKKLGLSVFLEPLAIWGN